MLPQSTNTILMVRPACFGYNPETADSNAFQVKSGEKEIDIHLRALAEFDNMVAILRDKGVKVTVVQDQLVPNKPDAIFPNNWMSTHHDGTLVLYPMMAANRRLERLNRVVELISEKFRIEQTVDFSSSEQKGRFLEGTGSIVFDHVHRIAHACRSHRMDVSLLNRVCDRINYEPLVFDAVDTNGLPIYHTNVLMAIGSGFVIICSDSIVHHKNKVLETLAKTDRKIIDITYTQMLQFAGNMLELVDSDNQKLLILSASAYGALAERQKATISERMALVPIDISTIEKHGGGSVRCMMAEIFLPNK